MLRCWRAARERRTTTESGRGRILSINGAKCCARSAFIIARDGQRRTVASYIALRIDDGLTGGSRRVDLHDYLHRALELFGPVATDVSNTLPLASVVLDFPSTESLVR